MKAFKIGVPALLTRGKPLTKAKPLTNDKPFTKDKPLTNEIPFTIGTPFTSAKPLTNDKPLTKDIPFVKVEDSPLTIAASENMSAPKFTNLSVLLPLTNDNPFSSIVLD